MRLLRSMIYAGALFAAAPALAQDNSSAASNVLVSNAPEANAVAPSNNADQNLAAATPSVMPPAENGAGVPAKPHAGFPWGVLGLIGLIGLLGARKAKG